MLCTEAEVDASASANRTLNADIGIYFPLSSIAFIVIAKGSKSNTLETKCLIWI